MNPVLYRSGLIHSVIRTVNNLSEVRPCNHVRIFLPHVFFFFWASSIVWFLNEYRLSLSQFCFHLQAKKSASLVNPLDRFYSCSSVHRNSGLKKSNKMQQCADIYLLLNYSTCFGRPPRPSSGVHKTVVAASGTDHTIWGASKSKQARSPDSMICTRGCNYSFMYSWWRARWTPETCRVS